MNLPFNCSYEEYKRHRNKIMLRSHPDKSSKKENFVGEMAFNVFTVVSHEIVANFKAGKDALGRKTKEQKKKEEEEKRKQREREKREREERERKFENLVAEVAARLRARKVEREEGEEREKKGIKKEKIHRN